MSHSHGKKRRRYSRIGGHLFAQSRKATTTGYTTADKSLCGLTTKEAADANVRECSNCETAKAQLWA